MKNRKGFRLWIFLCSLVFSLPVVCVGAGCSKDLLRKSPDVKKTWACDKAADDAMKRKDYKAGILLHERFLEKEPGNAFALYHLGYAHGQTGDHLKEVSYYEEAIALGFRKDRIFYIHKSLLVPSEKHWRSILTMRIIILDWQWPIRRVLPTNWQNMSF